MNPKSDKLLQQAGKYIALGKLTLALEQVPQDSRVRA
jgi:hypothetical protein